MSATVAPTKPGEVGDDVKAGIMLGVIIIILVFMFVQMTCGYFKESTLKKSIRRTKEELCEAFRGKEGREIIQATMSDEWTLKLISLLGDVVNYNFYTCEKWNPYFEYGPSYSEPFVSVMVWNKDKRETNSNHIFVLKYSSKEESVFRIIGSVHSEDCRVCIAWHPSVTRSLQFKQDVESRSIAISETSASVRLLSC